MTLHVLYLVRHGHYASRPPLGHLETGSLTGLGRLQVERLGLRLAELAITNIGCSPLPRAVETAGILTAHLPGVPLYQDELLLERTPSVPERLKDHPAFSGLSPQKLEEESRQAEEAYRHFFRPAGESEQRDLLVCHGNLIRYWIARLLGLSSNGWSDFDIHHASLSEVRVHPTGRIELVSYNDTGHLPYSMRTYRFDDHPRISEPS